MSHTPGPLQVAAELCSDNGYLTDVVVPGRACLPGTVVASCNHNWRDAGFGERRISWKEAQDNALLFAAAPDLKQALKDLLDLIGTAPGTDILDREPAGRAYRALAKAEGRGQ